MFSESYILCNLLHVYTYYIAIGENVRTYNIYDYIYINIIINVGIIPI